MNRINRVSNTKAANVVILVGLASLAGSIVGGLLDSYSSQYYQGGAHPSLKDHLQTFLNFAMNSLPLGALVVAAGFALRMLAQRTQEVGGSAETVMPHVPPAQVSVTADRLDGLSGDDVWRR
jgi:hypothetical protein